MVGISLKGLSQKTLRDSVTDCDKMPKQIRGLGSGCHRYRDKWLWRL